MSVYALNEPVVDALVARLQADLPAAIAEINARVSDGYLLDAVGEVLPYMPTPDLVTVWPTIGIGDAPSKFEDDLGSSLTGVHELLVVVFVSHPELAGLAALLRRYLQAIVTVSLGDRRLGDAWGVVARGTAPGPTLTDADIPDLANGTGGPATYASWTAFRLVAKRDEA